MGRQSYLIQNDWLAEDFPFHWPALRLRLTWVETFTNLLSGARSQQLLCLRAAFHRSQIQTQAPRRGAIIAH